MLDAYLGAATRVGKSTGARTRKANPTPTDGPIAAEIRVWASSQGMQVTDRGRVSAEIREAYAAAH